MRKLIVASLLLTGACGAQVVRDSNTYQVEVEFMSMAAVQQSDQLKGFIKSHCQCGTDKQFTTEQCSKAAKTVQVIQSRVPWHKAMMLYNAGITSERPPAQAPAVPPASDLCP